MLCLLIFSRPFLVMRTQSSFNHAGPDEEPTAILLRKPALEATVGNDPTIGGPARVRTGPDRSFRNECIIPIRANTRVGKGAQSRDRAPMSVLCTRAVPTRFRASSLSLPTRGHGAANERLFGSEMVSA